MSPEVHAGGCVCGAIPYEISVAPALTDHCHCRDCQRSSGVAMATVVIVPRSGFRLLHGKTKSFEYIGDSGKPLLRHFCGACGSPGIHRHHRYAGPLGGASGEP